MKAQKEAKPKEKDWSGEVTSVERVTDIDEPEDEFLLISAESGKEKREFLLRRE